jgi:hypothetical protein
MASVVHARAVSLLSALACLNTVPSAPTTLLLVGEQLAFRNTIDTLHLKRVITRFLNIFIAHIFFGGVFREKKFENTIVIIIKINKLTTIKAQATAKRYIKELRKVFDNLRNNDHSK